MARKKLNEIPVGCTGESKTLKGNIGEGKTETVLELNLEVSLVGVLFFFPTHRDI